VDLASVEAVAQFMKTHEIVEVDLRFGGTEIRLKKAGAVSSLSSGAGFVMPAVASAPSSSSAPAPAPGPAPVAKSNHHVVTSPFVGTFYRSPGPNQDAFVEVGQSVNTGDTLCIIEAMKLMNEIECETKGRVVSCLVENGTPVEFGEPLFEIEVR
jgi:acetyl-CoA carboxylase biotin carboxyl carrier protein